MQSVNLESRVLGVLPLAWGLEAIEAVLASMQVVAGESVDFDAVVIGSEVTDDINKLMARVEGLGRLYHLQDRGADNGVPGRIAAVFAGAFSGLNNAVLLTPPGPDGEELASCMAFQLNVQGLGRCQSIALTDSGVTAIRSVWGGRKTVALEVSSDTVVACLRAGKPVLADEGSSRAFVTVEANLESWSQHAIETEETGESMPPVESCKLVISGGRGVNEEGFELLEQIARKTGGTLGGSLPAVDAGMVPVVRQVGVSGKFVVPELYFAVGISGTPQHLAGIGPDTRIIAVNKDPDATIFEVAAAGVVGEWQELLPEILKALDSGLS